MNRKWIANGSGYGSAVVLLFLWLLVSNAFAQHLNALNGTSVFEIPPQPLPTALLRYTEQSGVHVTSSATLIENKLSQGVAGRLNARDALLRILMGTTLGFERIDDNSVVILPEHVTLKPGSDEKRALSIGYEGPNSAEAFALIGGAVPHPFDSPSFLLAPNQGHDFAVALLDVASSITVEPLLDRSSSFKILAQPLPSALADYSEQAGVQITAPSSIVERKVTQGVSGRVNARAALARILEGTGLEFEVIDSGSVILVPARRPPLRHERQAVNTKPQGTEPEEHEVVVTGSHIRNTRANASPVLSFDRLDFAESGATSLQGFLRTIPQNFNGGRHEASAAVADYRNGGRDNLTQGSGVNLRGLGNESTLVLLNGRRMAPGGFGGFYDISTIPLSAVERIDVLVDGSSAIYGSDAIGGVVNIVLRDNFDGIQSTLGLGTVTSGNHRELSADQLLGTKWARGSALLNLDYTYRDRLRARDRDFAQAIWSGNDLLPQEQRLSALLSANQEITPSVHLSIDAYASNRDTESDHSIFGHDSQLHTNAEAEHLGGTAEFAWTSPDGWEVALAHTYSVSDGERRNDRGNHAQRYNRVGAEIGISATEIKAYGPAFETPGGKSRLAIGAEKRRESMDITRVNIPTAAPRVSSNRSVNAAYAEIQIPMLGSDDPARHPLMEVTAAVRYEDYSDEGATDNHKFSARWSILPSVDLHASWGTSFRAPSLYQYDSTFGTGVLLYVPNPASPLASTLIAIASQAPHPNLGPETATTWTAGLSIAPGLLSTLRLSGTYFRVDYNNRITSQLPSVTPFTDASLSPLISMPADPEVLEWVRTAPAFANLTNRRIDEAEATLDTRTRNQSAARVSGIDFMLANDFQTDFGTITAGVNANYLLNFDTWVTSSSAPISILDTVFNPPDFRARGQVRWAGSTWSTSASVNYTDDYVDNQVPQWRRVPSWTTIDLSAAYTWLSTSGWTRGLTVRASVLNAADKAPPHINDRGGAYGDPGYDVHNASPLGRFISFEINKTW